MDDLTAAIDVWQAQHAIARADYEREAFIANLAAESGKSLSKGWIEHLDDIARMNAQLALIITAARASQEAAAELDALRKDAERWSILIAMPVGEAIAMMERSRDCLGTGPRAFVSVIDAAIAASAADKEGKS